jgi:hypothetical protein
MKFTFQHLLSNVSATLVAGLLLATAGAAKADSPTKISNRFGGPARCLDTFNGGPENDQPHLAECGNFSGQFWRKFNTVSGFMLMSGFRGGQCLTQVNGNRLLLTPCEFLNTQVWRTERVGEYLRLKTLSRPDLCADVVNGGPRNLRVELQPCADLSGQHWRFGEGG